MQKVDQIFFLRLVQTKLKQAPMNELKIKYWAYSFYNEEVQIALLEKIEVIYRIYAKCHIWFNYTNEKPWVCCIACINLYLSLSLVLYRGKSNKLKQVWATGRNLSSAVGCIMIWN